MLRQNGYNDTANLTGGYKTWKAATSELFRLSTPDAPAEARKEAAREVADDGRPIGPLSDKLVKVDACGLQCPGPIIRLKQEIDALSAGDRVRMQATDPGFARDVKSWCTLTGNELVSLDTRAGIIEAVIEKKNPSDARQPAHAGRPSSAGATLIVFSNDLDKALASLVLANGAAATGKEVTMFYTFWGLSVLRKHRAPAVKKDLMGRMFGMMLPHGMKKLALSSMNFGGMGASMMKSRMKSKNVDQLESMFAQARMAGVRMVACQMSMDIMGITKEELLDGVEIGGVATYMEAASSSNVNLFI
jgi:peroxiredoxin family protein/TusA-related sulfurtransferase